MTDEGYNGWKNRETWAFCLWYSNDQGMYEQAKEYATDYASAENFGPRARSGYEGYGEGWCFDHLEEWGWVEPAEDEGSE